MEVVIMLHEPAAASKHDPATPYKMRLGVWMFLFYSLFYAGFIAINIISPISMEKIVVMDLNLAVVYGFGLIIVALIQALVYDRACNAKEVELAKATGEGEAK
jgi:uncharacterized membrane protein (DUF485 family)